MLTETTDGFIAENGNNIFVVSIHKDLAVLNLYVNYPSLCTEPGTTVVPHTTGLLFGNRHVYMITPEVTCMLALAWYRKMIATIPLTEMAMGRFLQKIVQAGTSSLN